MKPSDQDGRELDQGATSYTDAGFSYGAGWPIVKIETPWAVGCQEHVDDDLEPTSTESEVLTTELLSEEDVASILSISVKAVQRLVREKKLGCVQLTKRKRAFTQELIEQFIGRESGISPGQRDGVAKGAPLSQRPITKPIPVEDARALLKKVMGGT